MKLNILGHFWNLQAGLVILNVVQVKYIGMPLVSIVIGGVHSICHFHSYKKLRSSPFS